MQYTLDYLSTKKQTLLIDILPLEACPFLAIVLIVTGRDTESRKMLDSVLASKGKIENGYLAEQLKMWKILAILCFAQRKYLYVKRTLVRTVSTLEACGSPRIEEKEALTELISVTHEFILKRIPIEMLGGMLLIILPKLTSSKNPDTALKCLELSKTFELCNQLDKAEKWLLAAIKIKKETGKEDSNLRVLCNALEGKLNAESSSNC